MTAVTDSPFDSANCAYKFNLPSSKAYYVVIASSMEKTQYRQGWQEGKTKGNDSGETWHKTTENPEM